MLPRQQALAYQRALIDSVSLLNQRRQDLEFARAELAALISLPSGSKMVLADDTPEPQLPTLAQSIDNLELMALENRPEIMEEWYRKRANQQDIKIAKAELWPNVSLNWGYNYDSNQYLYNNHWSETGLQVSINLLKFLRLPAIQNLEVSQKVTDDARRVALSMAVLTQVRVGVLRYNLAAQEVAFADESLRVDESLLRYAQAARTSDQGSELEVIRTEGRYLLSRYQREAAYSQAQAAWGRLYNSVGLDVQPEAIAQHDVQTLAKAIEQTIKKQENQALLTSNGGVPYALPN